MGEGFDKCIKNFSEQQKFSPWFQKSVENMKSSSLLDFLGWVSLLLFISEYIGPHALLPFWYF